MMEHTNQPRQSFGAQLTTDTSARRDLALVAVWVAIVGIGGVVVGISAAQIGVAVLLPLAALGALDLFRRLDAPTRSKSFESIHVPEDSGLEAKTSAAGRELERIIGTLHNLITQQMGDMGEQVRLATQSSRLMDDFYALADRARREAVHLSVSARQSKATTQDGRDVLAQTLLSIDKTRTQTNEIVERLTSLTRHIQRVGETTALIGEIATESNFLSLNAAIEAARAGEQGRTFATVAEEISALSDQSHRATAQLRDALVEIQQAMEKTVDATEAGAANLDNSVTLARQTESAIQKLTEATDGSASAAQKIVAAADQQAAELEQLMKTMAEINRVASQSQSGMRVAESIAQDLERLTQDIANMTEPAGTRNE